MRYRLTSERVAFRTFSELEGRPFHCSSALIQCYCMLLGFLKAAKMRNLTRISTVTAGAA